MGEHDVNRDDEQNDDEVDRQLNELLQELRMVLPGTTVLFGFLLSVSVSTRFEQFSRADRIVYFVAFSAAGLALVFLLAEAGYHRIRGKPYDKRLMVRTASRQAVAALVFVGVALVACAALVADLVYGVLVAQVITVVLTLMILVMWFALPLMRRFRGDH